MSSNEGHLETPSGPFQLGGKPASSASGLAVLPYLGTPSYDVVYLRPQDGALAPLGGGQVQLSSQTSGNDSHSLSEPRASTMTYMEYRNASLTTEAAANDQPLPEIAKTSLRADSSPMIHGLPIGPQLYAILSQKLYKWKEKSISSQVQRKTPNKAFEAAPLLERLPFYLSLGLLAISLLQFAELWKRQWKTPGPLKSTIELSNIVHFGYFLIQAVMSYERGFTPTMVIFAFLPLVALVAVVYHVCSVARALVFGLDLTIMSLILHALWIYLVCLNYFNTTNSTAPLPADPEKDTVDSSASKSESTPTSAETLDAGPSPSDMDDMVRCKTEKWFKRAMECPLHPREDNRLRFAIPPTALPLYLSLGTLLFHLIQALYLYSIREQDSTISAHSTLIFLVYFVIQARFCWDHSYPKTLVVATVVPIVLSVLHTVQFGSHSINFFATSLATIILQALWVFNVRELVRMRLNCQASRDSRFVAEDGLEEVEKCHLATALPEGISSTSSSDMDRNVLYKLDTIIEECKKDHNVARGFDQAPVLERIPHYLNVGILVCYGLEFVIVGLASALGASAIRSTILGEQIVILGPYFVVQTVLSAQLRFPDQLRKAGYVASVLSLLTLAAAFMPFPGQQDAILILISGCSPLLISTLLQLVWLYTFYHVRLERAKLPIRSFDPPTLGEEGHVKIASPLLADPTTDTKLSALLAERYRNGPLKLVMSCVRLNMTQRRPPSAPQNSKMPRC